MTKKEKVSLGMREHYPDAGSVFAEGLREHGTDIAFGVHGGDLWNVVDHMSRSGIKLITVHHEQTGVYAAEAYAKVTGRTGVFYADTGPGSSNVASALQQCYLSCSPALGICGGTMIGHERSYTIQPSYAEHMFSRITKWTQRVVADYEVKHFIAKAFKDSQAYPKGPCVIEFPIGAIMGAPAPVSYALLAASGLYKPNWRGEETGKSIPQPGGDPVLVERVVRRLCEAKRPIILAGDGVHWSGAARELIAFAELAQVPVCGRRLGRGAMPETHPLHFSSRIHRQVFFEADLLVLVGMKVGFFDSNFGSSWPRCIQINESPEHICETLDTEMIVLGGPKVILGQMSDCFRAGGMNPDTERAAWTDKVQTYQRDADQRLRARAQRYRDHKPVHHGWLCQVVSDTCEELYGGQNRLIIDGYTISGFIPPFPKARFSAQIMDASEQAGVGHGIGMAIGAAFGDPEAKKHPVIALMGDAGMGNAGFDIETALRFELPIVYVVTNNDGWLTGMRSHYYGKNWDVLGEQDRRYGQEFLPGIRYENLSQVFGTHGEYVDDPAALRPALERALRAAEGGKTAIVNVRVDKTLINPATYNFGYAYCWAHIPWDELPKRGKAIRRVYYTHLPWDQAGEPPMEPPDPWEPLTEEEMVP